MAKVFISYRREDSAAYAGRIQDRLDREFGRDLLFIDVDGIPLGINFVKILREEVAKCGVLLAVIGPQWLDARDEDGTRRLDNPNDFVRIEIAVALQREIPVIPILLDGTRIPKTDQLPTDLQELALRNGLNVRHASFHPDMDKLIRELKGQVGAAQQTMPEPLPLSTSPKSPPREPAPRKFPVRGTRNLGAAPVPPRRTRQAPTPPREPNSVTFISDVKPSAAARKQSQRNRYAPKLAPARLSAATALYNKGVTLGRSKEAIAVYNDLLARFGGATEMPLRELVAKALYSKGFTLGTFGRRKEEIAVYDNLLARYGSATEVPLGELVSEPDLFVEYRLGRLGRSQEEIAVYDDLLARFGSATEMPLRELVAKAFLLKGFRLGTFGPSEEEIAVYDDLLARFGSATKMTLRELVAWALVHKGFALGRLGRSDEQIAVYDDVIARFGRLREVVAYVEGVRSTL